MSINSDTSRILSKHLNFLVKLFEERLSYISNSGFNLSFIFSKLDMDSLKNFSKEFFGLGEYRIFGIDGSMAKEEYLEMLLLYVCSLGYYGKLKVNEENIEVNIKDVEREKALSLTASVPLWIEDLPAYSGGTLAKYIPQKYWNWKVHNDPEFKTFTYGDYPTTSPRAANLKKIKVGDYLFFFS